MKSLETRAKVLADSVSRDGNRLTTLEVTFPRMLLPEFNTHRMFSRNFRSSRAVPTSKLIKEVRDSPYVPERFGRNEKGMQSRNDLGSLEDAQARAVWLEASESACKLAEQLAAIGVHKQWVNRLLEPYMHVHGVVSSTEWANFFDQRDHPDAQPEIRKLAQVMKEAIYSSVPEHTNWHLPYLTAEEKAQLEKPTAMAVFAARCARVSYTPFNSSTASMEEDLRLYNDLVQANPPHLSPLEHPSMGAGMHKSNYTGWDQFRHMTWMNGGQTKLD